ncbi:titin isoform X1 [Tetranychus urticae]|uniref:titin isoform X1 n=1 Tax=Tetranychus urticae TaxID=32264 RepID=UPI00077BF30F|nr:titin isoform X1 [Tetranychus urticae]
MKMIPSKSKNVSSTVNSQSNVVKKLKTSNSSPPVFVRLPATAQFIEGGDAVFECQVSGHPMPSVVWTRRGAIIKNDDRHTVTYNPSTGQSILSIANLTMDDDGEYNCTACNTAGEASLTVSITKQPQQTYFRQIQETDIQSRQQPWNQGGQYMGTLQQSHSQTKIHREKSSYMMDSTSDPTYNSGTDQNFLVDTFEYRLLREVDFRETIIRHYYETLNINYESENEIVSGQPLSAPQVLQKPRNSKLVEGSDVTFQAQVSGNPPPKIYWFKDGRVLLPSQRVSIRFQDNLAILQITDATPEDAGYYTMLAENRNGRVASSCHLVIEALTAFQPQTPVYQRLDSGDDPSGVSMKGLKPNFIKIPSDVEVPEGKMVRFDCKVGGRPAPEVNWYHNGNQLLDDYRHKILINEGGVHSLMIPSTHRNDSGRYTCQARNKTGEATFDVNLSIIEKEMIVAPKFVERFKTTHAHEGESVVLHVRVIGTPIPRLSWQKDGNQIFSSPPNLIIETNNGASSLFINQATAGDAGWYQCVAANSAGTATTRGKVNVTVEPYRQPVEQTGLYLPKPSKVIEPESEPPSETVYLRHIERPKPTLKRQDSDERYHATRPAFTTHLRDLNVREGDRAAFDARLIPIGDPNLTIEWFHNDRPLEASSRVMTTFNFGYVSLTLLHITQEDAGLYVCRASNEIGEATTTATLNVCVRPTIERSTVLPESLEAIRHLEDHERYQRHQSVDETFSTLPPVFVKSLTNLDDAVENGYAHFEAQITPVNDPTMKVDWYFNGQPLAIGSRISTIFSFGYVALNISYLRIEDSGVYMCKATNSKGEAVSTATLKIRGTGTVTTRTDLEEQQEFIRKTQELEAYRQAYHGSVYEDSLPSDPPTFKRHLTDQINILEGRTAHFEGTLEPTGDPSMKVTWLKDGYPVEASSRINSFFNFGYVALTIEKLELRDTGQYTCIASNNQGQAQTSARLTVISKKSIITDVQYEDGWEKIRHLEDSSRYHGTREEEIEINEKPKFTSPLIGPDNLVEAKSAHFETRLEPMSDPTMRAEWFFNGRPLTTGHRFKTYFDFGYVALDILYVFPEDTGLFTVRATNKLGEVSLSKQLTVTSRSSIDTSTIHETSMKHIQYLERGHDEPSYAIDDYSKVKPYFVQPLRNPNHELQEGSKVHLEAQIEPVNDPSLTVAWFFNGKPLKTGSRFVTRFDFGYISLDILDLFYQDTGEYTVKVTNQLGSAHSSASIKVTKDSRVVTASQYPDSAEQIRHLEDHSRYKRQEMVETSVDRAPIFTKPLKNVETFEGTNVHLESRLLPSGDNSMVVEWFVNGVALPVGHRFRPRYDFDFISLDLLGVYAQDSGIYTCKAKNALGEAVTSCNITIYAKDPSVIQESQHPEAYQQIQHLEDHSRYKRSTSTEEIVAMKPKFLMRFKDVAIREGGVAHFECRIEPINDPKLRVEWYHNGVQMMVGSRFQPFHDFGYVALNILKCIEEDSGVYTCRIINELGSADMNVNLKVLSEASIELSSNNPEAFKKIRQLEDYSRYQREQVDEEVIRSGPVFTTAPRSLVINEGERARFECSLTPVGDPNLKVEWFKDGKPVKQGTRFVQIFDFGFVALEIMGTYEEDSGRYTCKATNAFGEAVTSADLKCHGKKSLITEPQLPESLEAIQALEGHGRRVRAQIDEPVTTQAPIFTSAMKNIELQENGSAHFETRIIPVGDPTLQVEWFQNGLPLLQGSRVRTQHDFGYVSLDLQRVLPEDSGTYTCKATNALGQAMTSATLKVTPTGSILVDSQFPEGLQKITQLESQQKYVREQFDDRPTDSKPVFVTALKGPSELVEGSSGHYECRIEPFPDSTMKVEWFRNNQPLTLGHRFRTMFDFGFAALDILQVISEDSGEYTIKASNHLGSATSSISIRVKGKESIILEPQQPDSIAKIRALEGQNRYYREEIRDVEIREKPNFGRPLYNLDNLHEGQTAHLEATLTPVNDPSMHVEWFVNGVPIATGSRFKTMHDFGYVALDIADVVPSDSGVYMCKATNKNGEAVVTCSVRVTGSSHIETNTLHEESLAQIQRLESTYVRPVEAPLPPQQRPIFTKPLKSLDGLKEGQSAHLECRLEPINDPKLRVEWFVNGTAIKTGHRFRTTHDFGYVALDILYVFPEDSGTYFCRATNELGEAVTTASIAVAAKKSILSDTYHPEGLEKIAALEAQGLPQRAEIEDRPISKPVFVSELRGRTEYNEGQASHFEGRIEPAHDPNLKVEMYHNGKLLSAGARFHRIFDFGYVALDIMCLVPEDSGTYTVRAFNQLGETRSSITLQVHGASSILSDTLHSSALPKIHHLENPVIVEKNQEVATFQRPVFTQTLTNLDNLIEGGSAHLECRLIPVGDSNLKVEWFRNSAPLQIGSRFKTVHDFGYVALDIMYLMPDQDAGIYMCKATNQLGEAITSCSLKIKTKAALELDTKHPEGLQKIRQLEESSNKIEAFVPEKIYERPVFTAPLSGPNEIHEGQPIHFEARVIPTDDPNLTIHWFVNGVELKSGSRFRVANDFGFVTLDIAYAYSEDSGIYMCKAVNAAGEAVTSASVRVKSKSSILLDSLHPEAVQKTAWLENAASRVPERIETKSVKAPVFTKHLTSHEMLVEGQNVHIGGRVEPVDDEKLIVQWYKNGKILEEASRIISRFDFGIVSLDVVGVRPDDSGIYTCRAVNEVGEAISTCTIKVEGREGLVLGTEHPESLQKIRELESVQVLRKEPVEPEFSAPVFITHLNNVELKEGETAHFECRVEPSKDNSLKIEFFHNNRPLQTGSRFSVKNDFGFITLDISSTQAEDSGIYTCKATNAKGQALSTGSLKVTSKSSIILTPQHPMGPEALEKIQQLEARSGYITPIVADITYPKPYFVVPLQPNFATEEGKPLHLECRIEPSADPNLTIEWFVNGKQLDMGNRFNLINDFGFVALDFKDTWDRDSGIYTCKAKNGQGEAFTSTTILVLSSETSIIESTLHPEGKRGLEEIQRLEESLRRKEITLAPEEGRAPVFTSQFKPMSNLSEGDSSHFEATLEPVGDQTMTVEWFHNGKTLSVGHRIRTYYAFGLVLLEIVDLRHEDEGEYKCVAKNKWGSTEAFVNLTIIDREKGEKPKFTRQLNSLSNLKEGDSAHFECNLIPVGDPNLFVKWFHNRVELRESSRIKTLSDFGFVVMDISFAHEEDSGEYVCVATNKYGSDVTRCNLSVTGSGGILRDSLQPQSLGAIAALEGANTSFSRSHVQVDSTLSAPPKFITQIVSLTGLVEGQSAHFEAQLSPPNDPYLKTEWYVNGKLLPNGHRFRTFHDFGIVILDILDCVAEDSGEYVCKAINKLGTDITRATLIIKAKSSVIYDPQIPPEMTSNERIIEIEEMRSRRRTEITEVTRSEAPRFIKPLENPPVLREGENAHLEAKLTPTDDPDLQVLWFKNSIALQASTRMRTIHDFGFVVLEISPIYPADSGVYTCKAVNKFGEAVTTCTIQVTGKRSIILESQLPEGMEGGIEKIAAIEEAANNKISEVTLDTEIKQAPKFLSQPDDQELPEDAMAHFECRLTPTTDPTMKVEWFFNGRSLVTGSRVKTISDFGFIILEIAGVYSRDSGIYTCKASNAYGEATISCRLTVKSKQSIILEPQLPESFITGTESIQKLEENLWRTPEMIYDQEKSMPPRFVTHLKELDKIEGESAHFECRLEPVGDPHLRIEWYHNGVLLLTGSRVRTVNDFGFVVLEIDWLLPRDTGEYVCRATNKFGTDVTKAVLKVKSKRDIILDPQLPPEFSVDKLKQLDMRSKSVAIEEESKLQAPRYITQIQSLENLVEGDSAHFECKLLPVDDPNLRVEWYHNGEPLITGHRFKTTHDFGFVALDILYIHPEDSGEYIARAVNQVGEDLTRAIIRCRARQKIIYNPQLPKEMESGIQKIAQIESSRQRFESAADAGNQERGPPMFVMKPEPQTVLEGEWAKFCCRVIGYPRPRVMWVLNGNTIINGSRYKLSYDGIYHLDIPKSRQYDKGKVEVYARNILGEAHCWTSLDVRPRNDDYRAVLKHSPRPWYDYDISRYQKERKETELDKIFEEKLTPGGTEKEVWRTEELSEDERVKIREFQTDQEGRPEIKKYTTEAVYADKKAIQEVKPAGQSNVSWMAKSYQTHVESQSKDPLESVVHGKEIYTKQQKQIQKELQGDLEITRKIKTTETMSQEHKGVTKERRVIGPPRKTKPPEFTKKIQPVRVYEGERATFECHFSGDPVPTIIWFRENFEIQNSRDFQIETTDNKSSLTIREVYLEDSGVFSVKAENAVGSAKSSANLVVEERKDHKSGAVPPSFSKTIEDTRASVGELVRLDARVIGSKPLDVYWLKNGSKILPGVTHKMIDDEDQNTLLILEAVPEDSGNYECVAINQVGEARCQARVAIDGPKTPSVPSTPTTPLSGKERPPMFTEQLKDIKVNEGEPVTFKCKISGVSASQVSWYKGDSLIKQSRYFRMGHERDAFTLKISEAFPEDEGVYKCIATNSLGSVTSSARLQVILPDSLSSSPSLSPLQDLRVPVGNPARFVTSISGCPTPSISWYREGQLIQHTRDFQMFQDNASCSLVIRQVYPEDSGTYVCRATNDSGQAETSARLIVEQIRK